MPGLVIPDVTLLTASANTMTAYMAAMRTYFTSSSTKFGVKLNSPTDDGFTLVPVAVGEDWEMNFRRTTALLAQVLIDPLENVTAPGNTGVAPTLTDSSEASPEQNALNVVGGGAEDVDFYVVEMDDAIFVLFMDSGKTHTPRGMHAGRVYVPFFTDGVNGDHYADGLGIMGYIPRFTTSSGTGYWMSTTTGSSALRIHQTGWKQAQGIPPAATSIGRINLIERVRPYPVAAVDIDSFSDNDMGFTRYLAARRVSQNPGTLLDAGVGKDAWCSISYTNAVTSVVIPWNRGVTPAF